MSLSLPDIPTNIRTPGFYGSFSTGVPAYSSQQRMLLIGPKIAGGSAADGVAVRVSADPRADFGNGSVLAEMATIARLNRPMLELWALPVPVVGTAATATITVNAVPPAGTYAFWVFGRARRCEITVAASGETAATVAAKIAAAASKSFTFAGAGYSLEQPVTVAAADAVVTLTLRSAGTFTNGRTIVHTRAGDEVSPLGAYVTVAQTNGAGTPDVATALAGIAGGHFQTIATAWDDDAVIAAIDAWLAEQWLPINMKYGIAVLARTGTSGTLAAAGNAMNAKTRVFAGLRDTPTPTWVVAAGVAAILQDRFNLGMDISQAQIMARALAGIPVKGVEPSMTPGVEFTPAEVNNLYFDGVTPLKPEFDGTVTLGGRVITTYQRSFVTGLEDTSWLDISDVMIPAYAMYFIRHYAANVHAATSLVSDERKKREGQTRPKDYRETCINAYARLCDEGICDDLDFYASNLIAEMADDRKRINAQHPVRIAAPLLVMANDIRVR